MSDLVLGLIHAVNFVVEGVLSVYARVTSSEADADGDATDERSITDSNDTH
ncbi:hypothetical protein HTZ84_20270 [Haloterrigena sp. SYSU A558-1]|uniref:Uncharacterized protein n=1 Tax=Haloterrigena gelatinilytica TaxID=2741724 RepID=A0A8J8GHL9_9EURY|nr:hypothetical protein [Haloterrigena gelatinilytica]NUB89566.1 hypothetical protein [Haloterrigena gelatinilytica]NUC74604.1 hypothetical protein [Haloterrigena gelatinilytica]